MAVINFTKAKALDLIKQTKPPNTITICSHYNRGIPPSMYVTIDDRDGPVMVKYYLGCRKCATLCETRIANGGPFVPKPRHPTARMAKAAAKA